MQRRRFALDHNFPEPVLDALALSIPMAELVPVRKIRAELTQLDDWELLKALHEDPAHWDGLITNDAAILSLAPEMAILAQTKLTLVVVKGQGHSPIRATGVLLCHLPFICHHTTTERAQVWRLRVAQKKYEDVEVYLREIAEKQGISVHTLLKSHRLRHE